MGNKKETTKLPAIAINIFLFLEKLFLDENFTNDMDAIQYKWILPIEKKFKSDKEFFHAFAKKGKGNFFEFSDEVEEFRIKYNFGTHWHRFFIWFLITGKPLYFPTKTFYVTQNNMLKDANKIV
ncbi:hypothetical protein K8R62_01880 [bacterium]|nr:hypothetical protein [bacterium]